MSTRVTRVPSVSNVADREAERLAPLLLLGLEVEVRRPVIHPTDARDGAGLEQQLLAERRLAGTRVAGQDDAPKVGEIDALVWSWAVRSSFRRAGRKGVRPS